MIENLQELESLLKDTALAHLKKEYLEFEEAGYDSIFTIYLPKEIDAVQAWQLLYEKMSSTGRYPLLVTDEYYHYDGEEFLNRCGFEDEEKQGRLGDTPQDIIQASEAIDVDDYAKHIIDEDDSLSLQECVEIAIQETSRNFGQAPKIEDIDAFLQQHHITDYKGLEFWFLQWEKQHCPTQVFKPENLKYLEWYNPQEMQSGQVLLLMPFTEGEKALAYLHFYGAELGSYNSQYLVARLKQWREKYGVELVAHHGTMLNLRLPQPIANEDEAFEVAYQQDQIAPCTLGKPGVSIREHTRSLMHATRWFLHERP